MRLAIDFDGTIADTNRVKADWILGKLGMVVEPWRCDRTHCVPIIGAEAYEEMSDQVYERESTLQCPEVPGAADALLTLSARAEIHVVTARPPRRMEFAREWFIQNQLLPFVNGFHSSISTSKEEICRMVGASVLIDDDLRHLESVRLAGLRRILLQDGRTDLMHSLRGVVACRSWAEVLISLESGGFGDGHCDPDARDGLTRP